MLLTAFLAPPSSRTDTLDSTAILRPFGTWRTFSGADTYAQAQYRPGALLAAGSC